MAAHRASFVPWNIWRGAELPLDCGAELGPGRAEARYVSPGLRKIRAGKLGSKAADALIGADGSWRNPKPSAQA